MKFPQIMIAILLMTTPLVAQDFYEQQLRAGQTDAAAGRLVPASDELRIAAFGFLDRPPLLISTLVSLALVQNSLGDTSVVTHTLDRFLEVERRFGVYADAQIDEKSRTAFEALLLKTEPRSALTGINSLAKLTRSDMEKASDLPADKRAGAYEEGFQKSPRDIEWPLAAARDAVARGDDDDVIRWSRRAVAIDSGNDAARAMLAHALTRHGDCRAALRELASFSASEIRQRTDLAGDQVVCLVTESRWSDAEAAAAKLPAQVQQRTDVARALQTINARRAAATATSRSTVAPAKTTSQRTSSAPPATTATKGGTTTSTPSTTRPGEVTRANAMKSAEALASARALVRNKMFSEAAKVLQPAAAADPANRQLRMALLESAAMAREWPVAAAQVGAVSPFADGEEVSMFYAAAALFEAGRKADAFTLMQRARPKLTSSLLVDYYSKAILGTN